MLAPYMSKMTQFHNWLPASCHAATGTSALQNEGMAPTQWFYNPCMQDLAVESINWGVITGSALVQMPQIVRILFSSSVVGLSAASFGLNGFATMTFVLYNIRQSLPFSTWGESLFVCIQNFYLLLLCWSYSPRPANSFVMMLTLSGVVGVAVAGTSENLSPLLVQALGLVPTILMLLAKLPQILQNFWQQHTGQLSALSTFLVFAGSAMRLLTVLTKIDDILIRTAHILACLLNGLTFVQVVAYWTKTSHMLKQKTN